MFENFGTPCIQVDLMKAIDGLPAGVVTCGRAHCERQRSNLCHVLHMQERSDHQCTQTPSSIQIKYLVPFSKTCQKYLHFFRENKRSCLITDMIISAVMCQDASIIFLQSDPIKLHTASLEYKFNQRKSLHVGILKGGALLLYYYVSVVSYSTVCPLSPLCTTYLLVYCLCTMYVCSSQCYQLCQQSFGVFLLCFWKCSLCYSTVLLVQSINQQLPSQTYNSYIVALKDYFFDVFKRHSAQLYRV